MNKMRLLFLALFFWTTSVFLGQTSASFADMLSGTWYLANSYPETKDSLIYSRISKTQYNWGDRIEFNTAYSFVDAYSARCGNDSQIHKDVGTWQLSGQTITTSIPISVDLGTKHIVVELTLDKLVLVRTN
jgi:hypothetical protein